VGVELLGEINELTTIARILEQYDVLRIQTDCPHVSVLIKEVLQHEDHRDVSLMRTTRYLVTLSSASSMMSSTTTSMLLSQSIVSAFVIP